MGMIHVFGVELPILLDSFRITTEHVGMEFRRNANGYLVGDRRHIKNVFEFDTAPRGLEESMLYRSLLEHRGDYWPFQADAYSSKGLLATGTGGYLAGGFTTATGQTMILPVPPPNQDSLFGFGYAGRDGHTLAGWRTGGTSRLFAWSWRALANTVTNKRECLLSGSFGAPQGYSGTETFSCLPDSQTITVTQGTGTFQFSKMLWIPRFFGTTELDTLLTGMGSIYPSDQNYYPSPPRILVRSDMFPQELVASSGVAYVQRNIVAIAEVSELRAVPHSRGGVFDKTSLAFSAKVQEV